MSSSKPGPAEKQAADITNQNVAERGKQNAAFGNDLSFFEGRPDESSMYKSLLTTGRESTSRAYDAAKGNMTAQAHAAGFGYEQPATQGSTGQLEQQEASDMAALPRESLLATAPFTMQAANARLGGMNAFNPNGSLSIQNQAEQARLARQSSMWQSLAKLGTSTAMPFVPGQYA